MRTHDYDPRPSEGTPIDSAIAALEKQQVDKTSNLSEATASLVIETLRELSARFSQGEDVKRIVAELSRLYWQNQDAIQEDDAAYIVRVLADDFGSTLGLDFGETFAIDRAVQDEVDRQQTREANMRLAAEMGRKAARRTLPF